MEISTLLYVSTRAEWRAWLAANFDHAADIWLVAYRVGTSQPSVVYNDAVEEALCFGWIDSTRKTLDEQRTAQRYSPRRAGSGFSQPNKERLARLIERGQVHPRVLAALGDVRADAYTLPEDIVAALQSNAEAWQFFSATSSSYQRIRVAYVDSARDRPEEFEKRLRNLIAKSAARKQFGYGIEAYF